MLIGNKNSLWGKTISEPTIYDDATVIYSLRNFFNWTDAILKIRRSSDDALKWVFFDGDTVTLNSLVGDSRTVASATNLGTWIGSNTGYAVEWIGQISTGLDTDKILSSGFVSGGGSDNPTFINSGVIVLKNGLPTIDFTSFIKKMEHIKLDELDSGNSFTILTNSHSISSNIFSAILTTTESAIDVNRFTIYNDRSTNKLISSIRNTSAAVFQCNLLVQQNTENQKLITNVVTSSELKGYYNSTFQENQSWSGNYVNNKLVVGVQLLSAADLDGGIQEIIIFPSDKTADLSGLHADINSYYSIY